MTPEMKFAQMLGQIPTTEKQKVAHVLREKSVDELERIVRSEMGLSKTASKTKEAAYLEKVAEADAMGREMAHEIFEKLAALGAIGMGVGKAINAVTGAGMGMRAGVGAAGGAALGAAKNVVAPQRDANGQPVRGGALRGALMGAAGGAALGAGARAGLTAAGGMKNTMGAQIRRTSAHAMGARGMAPVQAGSAREALGTMRATAAKPSVPKV